MFLYVRDIYIKALSHIELLETNIAVEWTVVLFQIEDIPVFKFQIRKLAILSKVLRGFSQTELNVRIA
jgi:hypothetical protein